MIYLVVLSPELLKLLPNELQVPHFLDTISGRYYTQARLHCEHFFPINLMLDLLTSLAHHIIH